MLEDLEIVCTERSPMRAEVVARLSAPAASGVTLEGELHGPFSAHARTLPHATPLNAAGSGEGLLARGALLEPCYWTPEVPTRYEARLRILLDGEIKETLRRTIGFRDLAVDAGGLRMGGRPWRLQAVSEACGNKEDISAWRDAGASLYAVDPTDDLLEAASREGLLVVCRLTERGERLPPALRRLARHAAAGVVVLNEFQLGGDPRHHAPNIVFAQHVHPAEVDIRPWSQLIVCGVESGALPSPASARATPPMIAGLPAARITDLPSIIAAAENDLAALPGAAPLSGWIAL